MVRRWPPPEVQDRIEINPGSTDVLLSHTIAASTTLWTPTQVATYAGYSLRSVRRWTARGWLRFTGLPHRPRYRQEDVDALLDALADRDPPAVTS